ncbi:protein hunchback-like [Microplitis mediator]|uniref:protein hunchback-like n=1 Tax=Microplitis mediator TaxID=375433 RepID=UPI002552812D|nr:protein hunchback-like [Microplitis mediator]
MSAGSRILFNSHLHENDVNCSLPNAKNDGGPFNGPKPGGPEPGQSTRRVNKRKSVKCKKCQVPFDTEVELRTHQEETHFNSEKNIRCPNENCAFVTDLKHHWEYHMKRHGGTKPFGCELCSYRCINKAMLKSHMKKHSKIFQYHCSDCQVKSNFHHDFKKHLEATGHRQGPTFDENENPSHKLIDVGWKPHSI